jgi:retinol dehydrogenase 12
MDFTDSMLQAQFKFSWDRTAAGIETSLQVNHLSTALLSLVLLPVLGRSLRAARLTFTSSEVHMFTPFKEHKQEKILEFLNNKQNLADPLDHYSVTKLLNVFWALELASQVSRNDIVINLLNPGSVVSGLHRDSKIYQCKMIPAFC